MADDGRLTNRTYHNGGLRTVDTKALREQVEAEGQQVIQTLQRAEQVAAQCRARLEQLKGMVELLDKQDQANQPETVKE